MVNGGAKWGEATASVADRKQICTRKLEAQTLCGWCQSALVTRETQGRHAVSPRYDQCLGEERKRQARMWGAVKAADSMEVWRRGERRNQRGEVGGGREGKEERPQGEGQ